MDLYGTDISISASLHHPKRGCMNQSSGEPVITFWNRMMALTTIILCHYQASLPEPFIKRACLSYIHRMVYFLYLLILFLEIYQVIQVGDIVKRDCWNILTCQAEVFASYIFFLSICFLMLNVFSHSCLSFLSWCTCKRMLLQVILWSCLQGC